MLRYLSADIICSENLTVFQEGSLRKTVNFEEQIMSKDKYMRIFSSQMEAIVFIIFQIFYATCTGLNIGEYHLGNIRSCDVLTPIMREQKYFYLWIITGDVTVTKTRWSGDVMKRPVHKNFNAVSHNHSGPEVLFLNLTWWSRGQISSVQLQFLLFAFSNRKFGRHGKWSVTFWHGENNT